MIGWIVLVLLVVGGAIFVMSAAETTGTAEDHMSAAFMGLIGIVLFGAGLLTLIGAGIWALM